MIYNALYIFGLKNYSMMDYNMAYWFKVSLRHTINFGASIIVVLLFLSHCNLFIYCLFI